MIFPFCSAKKTGQPGGWPAVFSFWKSEETAPSFNRNAFFLLVPEKLSVKENHIRVGRPQLRTEMGLPLVAVIITVHPADCIVLQFLHCSRFKTVTACRPDLADLISIVCIGGFGAGAEHVIIICPELSTAKPGILLREEDILHFL